MVIIFSLKRQNWELNFLLCHILGMRDMDDLASSSRLCDALCSLCRCQVKLVWVLINNFKLHKSLWMYVNSLQGYKIRSLKHQAAITFRWEWIFCFQLITVIYCIIVLIDYSRKQTINTWFYISSIFNHREKKTF